MAIQVIKDLRGLRIQVLHAPDADGVSLTEHLRRIGCTVEAQWPLPDSFATSVDVVMLSVDRDRREQIQRLLRAGTATKPTIVAVVSYEDPSTLQMVLESEALAVIERPIRPFGVLTSLAIARSLHLEREQSQRRLRKLERKLAGIQTMQRAKELLMASHGLSEEHAYKMIREQAMAKRIAMEEMAKAIIQANELLTYRPRGD